MLSSSTPQMRRESDLLGSLEVPEDALYGIQTLRGINNFEISKFHLYDYPLFIKGLAVTKWAAAEANYKQELISKEQYDAIVEACKELIDGKFNSQFPVKLDIKPKR